MKSRLKSERLLFYTDTYRQRADCNNQKYIFILASWDGLPLHNYNRNKIKTNKLEW